jgi:hypothetical protein
VAVHGCNGKGNIGSTLMPRSWPNRWPPMVMVMDMLVFYGTLIDVLPFGRSIFIFGFDVLYNL